MEKEGLELGITAEQIRNRIYTIRGVQVMLDSDLAMLYGVETKNLNRAMKRNIERFPVQFCFQISMDEYVASRCQHGTLNTVKGRGSNLKYLPYVYSEQGVAMLAGVLHSEAAIRISIDIINAFVAMRHYLAVILTVYQKGEEY